MAVSTSCASCADRLPINEDTSPPVNEPTWQEIKAWSLGFAAGWLEVHMFPAILGLADESIMTLASNILSDKIIHTWKIVRCQMDQMACGHHT